MAKTAVVYDRWLPSLGGGEVVACNIARILKDEGYDVLFISGKKVAKEVIFDKLHIDLADVKFSQVWNDELVLKGLAKGKDLFINISFMDYSRGFAKKNIYYVNFPTKSYDNLKGLVFTLLAPLITKFIKPIESMDLVDAPVITNSSPSYLLREKNKYAIYSLEVEKVQIIEFSLFLENFSKLQLEGIDIKLENARLLSKTVTVAHEKNILSFAVKFIPNSHTVYLSINVDIPKVSHQEIEKGNVYLLYPKIRLKRVSALLLTDLMEKIRVRLRAGIFVNNLSRLESYQAILTYSVFAQHWIKRYWKRQAIIVAPPVPLLFDDYNILKLKKENWICSVGRFFTLGHGKKQEILIEAFKKVYDKNNTKWELHLVGGLGSEPSSVEFFQYLKEKSEGYPIYFHINASRKEVEEIYLKTKIYWHATGFNEDENYNPIRFEHFGIAPLEAISAGCIPILFNGGGLTEIINLLKLDPKKYLFDSTQSLVNLTIRQIEGKDIISWGKIFNIMKNNYSKEVFKKNFLRIIKSV